MSSRANAEWILDIIWAQIGIDWTATHASRSPLHALDRDMSQQTRLSSRLTFSTITTPESANFYMYATTTGLRHP